MSRNRQQDYVKLSPKALKILVVLVHDYEGGNDGLTRQQIADRLGQYRFYPHDDKLIKQLEADRLIGITVTDKRADEFAWQDDYGFRGRNNISQYTRYHLHWLNANAYETVRLMLVREGLYQTPQRRLVEGVSSGLKSLFQGFLSPLPRR